MDLKAMALDFGGTWKKALFLLALFVLVVAGAWLIKSGIDSGYFSKLGTMLQDLRIFKAGMTFPITDDDKADANSISLNDLNLEQSNGAASGVQNENSVNVINASAEKSSAPANSNTTVRSELEEISKKAVAIDLEIKELVKKEKIQKELDEINIKAQALKTQIDAFGEEQRLTEVEQNLKNISGEISEISQLISQRSAS